MKIAIIGATGFAGKELLKEALERGHQVTAIVRNPERVERHSRVSALKGDILKGGELSKLLVGHDAVLSSVHFLQSDVSTLVEAVKAAGVPRLLVVGGAGSLEVAPGTALIDTPQFPAEYKAEAAAGADFLKALRNEKALNWTFLSPQAFFVPGEKTRKFRLGKDQLLVDAQGQSSISTADFAVAMLDEVEKPKHPRQRFTVGY